MGTLFVPHDVPSFTEPSSGVSKGRWNSSPQQSWLFRKVWTTVSPSCRTGTLLMLVHCTLPHRMFLRWTDRQTDRQAAARSAGTSEGAVIRAGVDTDPPAGWCWCLGPGRLSPWGAFKKSQRCFPLVLSLAFRTFHLFFFIKHEKY